MQNEYRRLTGLGVKFKSSPVKGDAAMPAMVSLDDTVGNWIMLYEPPKQKS